MPYHTIPTDLNTRWAPGDEANQLAFPDPLQRLVHLFAIYSYVECDSTGPRDTGTKTHTEAGAEGVRGFCCCLHVRPSR